MKSKYLTQEEMLQSYGAMFENLSKDLDLKKELEEYGYDEVKIQEGKAIYDKARQAFDKNIKETREYSLSLLEFKEKYKELYKGFSSDRTKSRIDFKEGSKEFIKLRLKGRMERVASKSIEQIRAFYKVLSEDDGLIQVLSAYKIDQDRVREQLQKLSETEKAYATHQNLIGESQQATKNKNNAFDVLNQWVSKFYKVARIALKDRPQLLESLGKKVKN